MDMFEQRWEILRHFFENHGNVAECVRKLRTSFERKKAPSAPYVRYLWRERKKLLSSSINKSVKSQKQSVPPRILLLWQKMSMKRYQHQLPVVFNNWTFRRHHWDEFCIKILIRRHTKSNWFRSWSQLTIDFGKGAIVWCGFWSRGINGNKTKTTLTNMYIDLFISKPTITSVCERWITQAQHKRTAMCTQTHRTPKSTTNMMERHAWECT